MLLLRAKSGAHLLRYRVAPSLSEERTGVGEGKTVGSRQVGTGPTEMKCASRRVGVEILG
jgi:hypothetical protein